MHKTRDENRQANDVISKPQQTTRDNQLLSDKHHEHLQPQVFTINFIIKQLELYNIYKMHISIEYKLTRGDASIQGFAFCVIPIVCIHLVEQLGNMKCKNTLNKYV